MNDQSTEYNNKSVAISYECSWCKIGGLSKEEYTHSGVATCHDADTNLPICEDCADAAGGRV